MNKKTIIVPKGIRFISDWKEFNLPNFPCIINKQITGCGFTESCLRNSQNVILISPRRILLENKKDQHPEENVYYFKNEYEKIVGYDKDLNVKIDKENLKLPDPVNPVKAAENIKKLNQLKKEVQNLCNIDYQNNLPTKILVTYDSFRHVKEALGSYINEFYVVVDEFQSIFTDSRFKSTTEMELLEFLKDIQNLSYVSATPMIDDYLSVLDYFKDLPYFDLDWETEDPTRVIKPQLDVYRLNSINSDAAKIINDYKSGNFERSSYVDVSGKIVEVYSKEAIFYVNSVKNICDIIKKNSLKPEECNVLCARSDVNEEKIRKAFGMTKTTLPEPIGKVPKEDEPNKIFTFCTRTVYLGADFYSDNARSFIFSDANIECLAVDITLDLPQILGRQRLKENPWKNRATLYYRLSRTSITKEEFKKYLNKKIETTNDLLRAYENNNEDREAKHSLAETYERDAKSTNYKFTFVAVNKHAGSDLLPAFNKLVMISEQRSFEIQQLDYKDRFQLFSSIDKENSVNSRSLELELVLSKIESINFFPNKMKYLCEESMLNQEEVDLILDRLPIMFKNYYIVIGPERMKALCYQKSDLEREYKKLLGNQSIDIEEIIYSNFKEGEKYTKSDLKIKLKGIYEECGYNKTPKALDIQMYFETKPFMTTNKETGKRDAGLELIKKLK